MKPASARGIYSLFLVIAQNITAVRYYSHFLAQEKDCWVIFRYRFSMKINFKQ